jgi:tetratricopeptide (TPR) repeat protein
MRPRLLPFLFVLAFVLATACGTEVADNQSDWLRVLDHKKAAVAPTATVREKQVYADSLAAFVGRNPTHSRAREVYHHIQLDFARELAALGRYQDAIRFYRSVAAADPTNEAAIRGLQEAADHLSVSREKLLLLEKGMSHRQVANILGKPMPGWTEKRKRRDATLESWYYRKTEGGVAGVYFRDGELFAAEENSQARLAPLTAR